MVRYCFLTMTVILFFSSTLYGQRPNTKKVAFKYIQPPEFPLPSNVKTYYSSISNRSARVVTSDIYRGEKTISLATSLGIGSEKSIRLIEGIPFLLVFKM